MSYVRRPFLFFFLVSAASSGAQNIRTLPQTEVKAFIVRNLWPVNYKEDGPDIVKTYRVDFNNGTAEEVQSIDVRFVVSERGKTTYEKTYRVDLFHDNPLSTDGSALPHHRAFAMRPIEVRYPSELWNTASSDHFEVIGVHAYTGEGDLHNLGHLFGWLSRTDDGTIIRRIKRDPTIATTHFASGATALDVACAASTTPVIQAMIAAGATLEKKSHIGGWDVPPIQLAAANDHPGPLAFFKTRDASVDEENTAGHTALAVALDTEHVDNARWLVENGANPSHHDHDGYPPAYYAARNGSLTGLDLVAKAGGELTYHVNFYGLMHLAAQRNDPKELEKLVSLGLPVDDSQAPSGFTPLMAAAWNRSNDAAKWLLQHGANLKARDKVNRGVLDFARGSNTLNTDRFFREKVLEPLHLTPPPEPK